MTPPPSALPRLHPDLHPLRFRRPRLHLRSHRTDGRARAVRGPATGRPTRGVGAALGASLLVAAAVALGACSGANNISGGAVGGCVRSLPAATDALHGSDAHLLGVHRVPADRLPAKVKAAIPEADDTEVCAVAFKGTFAAGRVQGARPTASGDYAVVLVNSQQLEVVGSYVGDHLPAGLEGHLLP